MIGRSLAAEEEVSETRPSKCRSRPAMILRSVVFPHPDGPNTQTNSLGLMRKDRSLSAVTADARPTAGNCLHRMSTLRAFISATHVHDDGLAAAEPVRSTE